METRIKKKYKITHAHTEKFKNSPIITLPNQLNKTSRNIFFVTGGCPVCLQLCRIITFNQLSYSH